MAWRKSLIKGKIMKNQIAIDSDTFYITQRLKEIDESYFVVFNFEKEKFEIHSSAQPNSTYCLTVPYGTLDERTLDLVRKTNHTNLDDLIKEMERENERNEKSKVKESVDSLKEVISGS